VEGFDIDPFMMQDKILNYWLIRGPLRYLGKIKAQGTL
jgi:hypothetical protein